MSLKTNDKKDNLCVSVAIVYSGVEPGQVGEKAGILLAGNL